MTAGKPDGITDKQWDYYQGHRQRLIDEYLDESPSVVDPDLVRDKFAAIGYDRSNVPEYQAVCKLLTRDIFDEALRRNQAAVRKVVFAGGLPATGKSSLLRQARKSGALIYDGTINDDSRFLELVQIALAAGCNVEVWIFRTDPIKAFKRNLARGAEMGRYVSISHYEKVAASINRRPSLLQSHFGSTVKMSVFEIDDKFKVHPTSFSPLKVERHELESIARRHQFEDSETLERVLA